MSELRRLIQESVTVGRNMQTDDYTDRYPWDHDDIKIQIYADSSQDQWIAEVEPRPGERISATKATEDEAVWWAREQWQKSQRERFASDKKDKND